MDWQFVVSIVLPILTFLAGASARSFTLGRSAENVTGRLGRVEADVVDVKQELTDLAERDDKQSTANAAAVAFWRERLADFEKHVAQTYARREDLAANERRSEAQLNKLEIKVDDIGKQMRALPGEVAAILQRA